MGELSNEVWLEIFKRLDGATLFEEVPLVCKRFNGLAKATTPLFAIKNDDGVLIDGVNSKEVQAAIEDKNLYIKGFGTVGLESIDDMVKVRNLVKNQPGLKKLCLIATFIAQNKSEASLADRTVKEAILGLKYLKRLDLERLEMTTRFHQDWVNSNERCPSKRQNLSLIPWSKEDVRKLLASNKSLRGLLLPSMTTTAFNFLLEDQDAKEWRGSAEEFVASGLHRYMLLPEPKVSWKNLCSLQKLRVLRAGELDADFWTALPAMPNLRILDLNLTMTSLEKIVSVKEEKGGSRVTILYLFCNSCIDWKRVPQHVLLKLFSLFPLVIKLFVECQIGNPLDAGDLFIMFNRRLLKKLHIKVYHVQDRRLDLELIQKLAKPSYPSLDVLTFSSLVVEPSDIAMDENETLFQPVLTRLFRGTNAELVEFGIYRHLGGVLQVWRNKKLEKIADPSRFAFPRWCKRGAFESVKYLKAENLDLIEDALKGFLTLCLAWSSWKLFLKWTQKA